MRILGTPEYHDAAEEPARKEETDALQPELRSTGFQGGYGSSSLKECIDLLNAKPRNAPAPLDSGADPDSVSPPQYAAIKEINLNTEVQKPSIADVLEFQGARMECAVESTPHEETRIYL